MTGNLFPSDGQDPVYRRTSMGQREAVFGRELLDPGLRRALLRVTGYTPRSRLGGGCAPYGELLNKGLICQVADPAPSFVSLSSHQPTQASSAYRARAASRAVVGRRAGSGAAGARSGVPGSSVCQQAVTELH